MPERYIGRTLGRFRIESSIGSGGFAWVYKGYDPELDIPVAVKVLKPQFAGDENVEGRFRKEASTAAKLRHPNIIRILAVGQEDHAAYFVMDYLPNGLVEKLNVMGTLHESLLIRLGLDVSAALAFAHREGVIHRDIKTDNVLYDEHGNAIVADFGIARALVGYVDQTGTNMVVGTPQYFSPEQARGLTLDGRADIYSLGVTMFKAATGVLPFQGNDWYDYARQHVEEPPPSPRSLNPSLSEELERIILTCLEKDRELRYPNAEAVHAALKPLLVTSESGTVVMPATSGSGLLRSRKGLRGRRASWGLGSAAAAVVALTLVATLWQPHGSAPARTLPTRRAAPLARPPVPVFPGTTTVNRTPSPVRELRVLAPPDAAIEVDGEVVGSGEWRSDSLDAGKHEVSASFASSPGCPSARHSVRVTLEKSGITTLKLTPRRCGMLVLDVSRSGARYVLTPRGSPAKPIRGQLTSSHATMLLAAGSYQLKISASLCADYFSDVTIVPTTNATEHVTLLCQ
ncbi:MAG: serine/threonine protein kinase [Gemmatimonadota bacterium]|nr:serine/threonine protein kinase [Gemmatimonadota bacterium]